MFDFPRMFNIPLKSQAVPDEILEVKTGSLDNAIREFSLAWPSSAMSHYSMLYEYGKRTRDFFFLRRFYFF